MTRDEILNMPAGRRIDALVAEKVMNRDLGAYRNGGGLTLSWQDGYMCEDTYYSTDIAAAWEVVEKLCLSLSPFVSQGKPVAWVAADRHDLNRAEIIVFTDTAPLAICRAALLAVMDA